MKIAYGSDLHLEFGELTVTEQDADVLILAGDIFVARDIIDGPQGNFQTYKHFLDQIKGQYEAVIYVMGNHEHYNGDINTTYRLLRAFLPDWVHILENESIIVQGQRFVGATLWTDVGNGNVEAEFRIQHAMNDYHVIEDCGNLLRASVTRNIHVNTMKYLRDTVIADDIVVTHHLPSFKSVHSKYAHDYKMSCAYASNLDEFILEYQPHIWFHGHSHEPQDYKIGNTRVTSNPRGYKGFEPQARDFEFKAITI